MSFVRWLSVWWVDVVAAAVAGVLAGLWVIHVVEAFQSP